MMIDAHQHFWKYNEREYGWIGPDMRVLKRDYVPDDLEPLARDLGFEGTVVIQARQTLEETEWLLDLADQYDLIRGVVGWVDLCSESVDEQLRRFCGHSLFRGVRHVVQDEPDPEFMLRPDFHRGIASLAAYGLTYDILVFPRQLPAACALVERFPEQPFVLDHLAKPLIGKRTFEPWRTDLRRLASAENVYCKASGIFAQVDPRRWTREEIYPYLDVVFDAFGPERIMIGSDWPVCTLAGSYSEAMGVVLDYVERLPSKVGEGVLGNNAARFYGLMES